MSLDSITLISLVVALAAFSVTFVAYVLLRRQMRELDFLNKGIDAYALVQEFSQREKKLEERLVEQKVKLEILELRQQRQGEKPPASVTQPVVVAPTAPMPVLSRDNASITSVVPPKVSTPAVVVSAPVSGSYVRSEVEALRVVLEAGERGATARQIQVRIGRSREHTARMMNSLFKDGLVERSSEARPFTYKITEKGQRVASRGG